MEVFFARANLRDGHKMSKKWFTLTQNREKEKDKIKQKWKMLNHIRFLLDFNPGKFHGHFLDVFWMETTPVMCWFP